MRRCTFFILTALAIAGCQRAKPSASVPAPSPGPSLVAPAQDLPTIEEDFPLAKPAATPAIDPATAALQAASLGELRAKLASDEERNAAATELALRGPEALPVLTEALEDTRPEVRAAAAYSLGQMGTKASSALAALRKRIAEDDHDAVKTAALFAVDAIQGK